ncbi:butyrophilin subfamily 1 member A1-like isoform X2 [Tyto alba]|uniref:butyrophilin subfamily 1 member A1-like isoform X2 n=1 Tax=Tyto alba TaxID=56313 RepID=UPI001C678823|nr:butyrophilin subfamily 1 member A1-like isoform X2 [Tyto alba]
MRFPASPRGLLSCLVTLHLLRLGSDGFTVEGPVYPIVAIVGQDIVLPCHLPSQEDARSFEIQWTRHHFSEIVHHYRNGEDQYGAQLKEYHGRTELVKDGLSTGNLDLRIRGVRPSDDGQYFCTVQDAASFGEATVELEVAATGSVPQLSLEAYGDGGVRVLCRSAGWYPQPQVLWQDPSGQHLTSVAQRRSPDERGLFGIEDVTVVTGNGARTFSCVVRNSRLNQERESSLRISAPFFHNAHPWMVALGVLLVLLVAFTGLSAYLWRRKGKFGLGGWRGRARCGVRLSPGPRAHMAPAHSCVSTALCAFLKKLFGQSREGEREPGCGREPREHSRPVWTVGWAKRLPGGATRDEASCSADHLFLCLCFPVVQSRELEQRDEELEQRDAALEQRDAALAWRKFLLPEYPDVVTLDPNTAHSRLVLSPDGRSVSLGTSQQDLPDLPERFSNWCCVLGQEGFRDGRHCWEVEVVGKVGGDAWWGVGVAKESVDKKGYGCLSPEDGVWALWHWKNLESLTNPPTVLFVSPLPRRIWVCLDCTQGLVTFINAENGAELFTFPPTSLSGARLRPWFWLQTANTTLRLRGSSPQPV